MSFCFFNNSKLTNKTANYFSFIIVYFGSIFFGQINKMNKVVYILVGLLFYLQYNFNKNNIKESITNFNKKTSLGKFFY